MLGVADTATVMMGAAGDEIWAYRGLPRETGLPAGVEFGPAAGSAPQLAFLRYTDATGWQVVETRSDASGATSRGPTPTAARRGSPRAAAACWSAAARRA